MAECLSSLDLAARPSYSVNPFPDTSCASFFASSTSFLHSSLFLVITSSCLHTMNFSITSHSHLTIAVYSFNLYLNCLTVLLFLTDIFTCNLQIPLGSEFNFTLWVPVEKMESVTVIKPYNCRFRKHFKIIVNVKVQRR